MQQIIAEYSANLEVCLTAQALADDVRQATQREPALAAPPIVAR